MTLAQQQAMALARARMRVAQAQPQDDTQGDQSAVNVDLPHRVLKGAMDPLTGLSQMLYNAVPQSVRSAGDSLNNWLADKGVPLEKIPEKAGFNALIANQENQYQQARQRAGQKGVDLARMGGNLISSLPLMAAAPEVAGASMPARIGIGAAEGGLLGTTQPVTGNADHFWAEKGKQAAVGAVAGGITAPISGVLARIAKPQTNPDAALLLKEGITPSPGQIMGGTAKRVEEKLRSLPIAGDMISAANRQSVQDLNRAAYNRALAPIGVSAKDFPVGAEGIALVKQHLSDAYNDLLPKLTFKSDPEFVSEVSNLKTMTAGLPEAESKQFDKVLSGLVGRMTPQGNMSGESLKIAESELGRIAKGYRGDASFDKRQLGDAIAELQNSIRKTLMRSNPNHAARLQAINKGYSNYAIIRNAAARAWADQGFSAAQLSQAVRAMDKSVGKGATATGKAQMQDLASAGRNILSASVPNSGTADRLNMAALASGFINPHIPAGLLAAGLPYTRYGQKLLANLMTQRPQAAGALANAIRKSGPFIGATAAPALLQQ